MYQITIFITTLLMLNISLVAANNGKIGGKVIDKSTLKPLAGANVSVQATQRGASTDADGHFIIKNLEPGSYNIEVHYLGYAPVKKNNVIVNPNRTTVLEVALEENLLQGEVVEVTGSYFEKARQAVVSTRTMNFEEIRRSPGDLVDIQRSMQVMPSVVSGSDQMNEIITRGGYPGENLFLMDNIEIPNPNHFPLQGSGGGPINMLNSYMVKKVDFYAGAFSAKYGDKASSVMDIQLREGSRERYRFEGQMGMAGIGILTEGPLSENASFLFSARKSYLDLIISSTGLTAVPRYYNLQSKITWDMHSKHQLSFNTLYGSDEINIENEESAGYGRGAENVDSRNDQFVTGVTVRSLWTDQLYSFTTVSALETNTYANVFEFETNQSKNTFFSQDGRENQYQIKTDFVYRPVKNFEMNFGISHKRIRFAQNLWREADTLYIYETTGDKQRTDEFDRIYPQYKVDNTLHSFKNSAYGQFAIDLWQRMRFTAGLRYHYFDYTQFSSWSPRVGLSFFASPKLTFNLAYGKHYQSPSYVDLIANEANQHLSHKYNHQFVLGTEYLWREDVKMTVELYHKNYDDVPVEFRLTTPEPLDEDNGRRVNAMQARSSGVELFLQKKLTDRFSTILGYSHYVAEAKDPRTGEYYPWDYNYGDILTFIAAYKFRWYKESWYQDMKQRWWFNMISWFPLSPSDEFEISMKFRYLGGRPYTRPVYYPIYQKWIVEEQQNLNERRYPIYHRLDFRIDRRFIFNNWNLVIFFDINNVYNRNNIWAYEYGVDKSGDKEIKKILQYQTLPVGGFSIEF
ncbi:MAG: TonB-dependent receptor plug domain-containing protein [Caldithrix sp.]|nr:TonB-dependent receptor plug domain-containing protein [Caldithrix sp.]